MSEPIIQSSFQATGLFGNPLSSARFVGSISGTLPTSGTYKTGDYVIDNSDQTIWIYNLNTDSWLQSTNQTDINVATLSGQIGNALISGTAAGGDLSGYYPNPTVQRIQGSYIDPTSPQTNQILTQSGGGYLTWTDNIIQSTFIASGVTGAQAGSRYIGGTVSGSPASFPTFSAPVFAGYSYATNDQPGLSMDSSHNLYTTFYSDIYQVTSGTLSLALNVSTSISLIGALALDSNNNKYYSDLYNGNIYRTSYGSTGYIGTGTLVYSGAGRLGITCIAFDAKQNIWFGSTDTTSVYMIPSGSTGVGSPTTTITNGDPNWAPSSLTFDKSSNLYITDKYYGDVWFTASGYTNPIYPIIGGLEPVTNSGPTSIVIDKYENMWIADPGTWNGSDYRLWCVTSGNFFNSSPANPVPHLGANAIGGLAVDNNTDTLWAFSSYNSYLMTLPTILLSGYSAFYPGDFSVDQSGSIWVNTSGNTGSSPITSPGIWKQVGAASTTTSLASLNLTTQTSGLASTVLYTTTTSGLFTVSYYGKITTAATTSSVLGPFSVTSVDPDGNTVSSIGQYSSNNTLTSGFINDSITVYAASGTNISYTMGYSSSGATGMRYNLYANIGSPGLSNSSATGVSAFNGRTGSIVPSIADYSNYYIAISGGTLVSGILTTPTVTSGVFNYPVINSGTLTGTLITATSGTFTNITATSGTFNYPVINSGIENNPTVTSGTFTNITVRSGTLNYVTVNSGIEINPTITSGTITNTTSTSGTFNYPVVNSGTLSNPTVTSGTFTNITSTNGTFSSPLLSAPMEKVYITGVGLTGTPTVTIASGASWYFNVAASGNFLPNITGPIGISGLLSVGQSTTVAILAQQGATTFSASGVQIDGITQASGNLYWQSGTAPASGLATNGIDVYVFTTIKTATNSGGYTILASQTKF